MTHKINSVSEVEKELVLERIKAMSDDVIISVGSKQLNKKELINNIESENETGQSIIRAQIKFLKAMASGDIYNYV